MSKVLKVVSAIILAVTLVVGVSLTGWAAPEEAAPQAEFKPHPRMLKGVVDIVDDENQAFFTIQAGERTVEITVNEGTKYFKVRVPRRLRAWLQPGMAPLEGQAEVRPAGKPAILRRPAIDQAPTRARGRALSDSALVPTENRGVAPNLSPAGPGSEKPQHQPGILQRLRQFGEPATFDDIDHGDRVVVQVVPRNDRPLAKLVLIIESTAYKRVRGTISDFDEDEMTITIEPATDTGDGAVTLTYDDHTTFVLHGTPSLEEGMRAMAVYVATDDGNLAKRVTAGMPAPEPAD